MERKYKFIKYACYISYITMAAVITLSPVLFETFHRTYGISYTKLGLLVLLNFFSQLSIDLVFSFFSKHFNIAKTVRFTPVVTFTGMVIYAVMPMLFPGREFFFISLGTIIFSFGAGLSEVFLSPTIAAIPSDNPDREMSKFHSVYAWGAVGVVVVSTLFIRVFGDARWNYLALFFAAFPVIAEVLFTMGEMPVISSGESGNSEKSKGRVPVFAFMLCIFLGSCAENTMSQWCSGFVETALSIPKFYGDLLGLALFSAALGVTRSVYGKYGKNIFPVLLASFIGAACCYLIIGTVSVPGVCLIACAVSGFFVSMLWPGTLIWLENANPGCGVVAYALMAAGGDCGASVAPQLMGIITDKIAVSRFAPVFGEKLNMDGYQVGMKGGMLLSVFFPLAGIVTVLLINRAVKRAKN